MSKQDLKDYQDLIQLTSKSTNHYSYCIPKIHYPARFFLGWLYIVDGFVTVLSFGTLNSSFAFAFCLMHSRRIWRKKQDDKV
jgi:hypothetical protein